MKRDMPPHRIGRRARRALCALPLCAASLVAAGCIGNGDPFEPVNRVTYGFNEVLDDAVLGPISDLFRFVVPEPVRDGLENVFANIATVPTIANDLLQGKPEQALSDSGRLALNSTVGMGGLIDVGADVGLEKNEEDIGQTLAVWGFDPGPYLVLPLFGPTTPRDGLALAEGAIISPMSLTDSTTLRAWYFSVRIVSGRAAAEQQIRRREEAATDPYLYTREGFKQHRRFLINDGETPSEDMESIEGVEEMEFEEDFDDSLDEEGDETDGEEPDAQDDDGANGSGDAPQ